MGAVTQVTGGDVTLQLPGGGFLKARANVGSAAVGQKVFVRDAVIEAIAQNLTLELIEI